MKISAPKYTRDFYPEEMRRREWIEAAWTEASRRAGFLPWDGPILETLDLYKRKSGDEIVEQLFQIVPKGSQELAIRPEMTPSLARMISIRQASLPRPVKWYTIGRMCRYERGQRGRLREFWQWNIDLLGVEGPAADAEVISVSLDGLELLGLTAKDVAVRINSRSLMASILSAIGIGPDLQPKVFAVTDKRGKIPTEELDKLYRQIGMGDDSFGRLVDLMKADSLADIGDFVRRLPAEARAQVEPEEERLKELFAHLESLGKREYAVFDIGVVRGLAYYTGPVFEIFDRQGELRAVCGGGRYDQLMELMGGQAMPACGFGMGDVVLGELLTERQLAPPAAAPLDAYVIPLEEERIGDALTVVRALRQQGRSTDFAPKPGNLGKILKRASDLGVRQAYLVGGDEWKAGQVKVRDLATRTERALSVREILGDSYSI